MCGKRVLLGIVVSALVGGGCAQTGTNPQEGSGGHSGGATTSATSTGGALASGGASAKGGNTGSGGAANAGGNKATGGVTSVGGSKGMDASISMDSSIDTDTVLATRDANMTGGNKATGGTTSAGGTVSIDGGKATGGATGSGGSSCGTTAATLKAAADCTGRLIGAALSSQRLSESGYATAAKEFNYVTCENEMKWDQIEPSKGQFSWSAADQVVNFASSNGMKVKGHTLVWYNQLPQWVSSLSNKDDVRSAMLAHIKGVMQHYKGKVAVWDVVNEAVSIEGTSFRDCPFYKYLGEKYIDEAFKAAREADPDVKLYYNDYNDEGLTPKSDFVYKLLKRLVTDGVPIDGVGMQMHYGKPNDTFTIADLKANIQRIVDLGLEVVYSEMDVHRCSGMTDTEQTTLYHDLIAACVAEPKCKAVTFWGITDKYSWLNSYSPLGCSGSQKPLGDLWDDNYKKKSAYTGVLKALLGQ
jgi:endo-1,4-beta-xylanase